tara:strand:+ start:5246 stop:6403 length:1158 start_codon:yes stop_codon:yes gene_type:complete
LKFYIKKKIGLTLTAFIVINLLITCRNDNNFENSKMVLSLDESAFQKIKQKRLHALEKKLLVKNKSDYVFGTLKHNNKEIKVKARLKGDHIDHLEGNRWSFRIIALEDYILNHKKISIQGVHTRGYMTEWIFHKLLMQEGLIYLQYDFFHFCVNDTLCGIYAFESHFDNYLLKMSNREFGPIMKFDETDFWDYSKYSGVKNRDDLLMINSKIKLTNKDWSKKHGVEVNIAKSLIDDFRNGRLLCNEVFDLDLWARFIAINELMAGDHALRWHNLRFYYNPLSKKIEPIGFDCGSWMEKNKSIFYHNDQIELFHQLMLRDSTYIKLIKKELTRITNKEYMEKFFLEHKHELFDKENLIKLEKPNYKFWESSFYHSQQRIKNFLNMK